MLVGRAGELAVATSALGDVEAGRGRLLVLSGEPGIGKTSLADAIAELAASRGCAVAWGRCWEGGGAPALYPWSQVFDALEIALPSQLEGGDARLQLFQAATDALAHAARARPLAIVLDDLHVSDVSSLLLLQFVARQLRRVRALVIATRRDVDAALTAETSSLLARIAREGETMALRRLDRGEVAEIVRGAEVGAGDDVAATIWQATQGNPFFLDELLRLLASQGGVGQAASGELPIPYGVREAIRQRLGTLGEPTRAVLEAAAVCGVECDPARIALVAGLDAVETARQLAEAVRVGALAELPARRLRFAHALVQDVVHRDLPAERCASLHLAAATALEQLQPDAPPEVEIAHHALAAVPRDAAATIARVGRAARGLVAALAHEDAVALAERARAALEPVLAAPRSLAELLAIVGEARSAAGDVGGSHAAYLRAAEHARAGGDGVALARAAVGYGSEFVVGVTDPALVALLGEALDLLPPTEPGWRARVLARLAAALQPAPDPSGPVRMAEEAVAAARALGDEATLLDVVHNGMAAMMAYVDPAVRRRLNEPAAALARRRRDAGKELRAELRLVFDCAELGDFTAAETHIEAYAEVAQRTRLVHHLWKVPLLRSMMALHEGRFADSDVLIEEAAELVARCRDVGADFVLGMHRWGRLIAEDRLAEASTAAAPLVAIVSDTVDSFLMKATMLAQGGDVPGARAALSGVDRALVLSRLPHEAIAASVVVDIACRIEDRELAEAAVDALRRHEKRWICWGMTGMLITGPVRRFLARAAELLGRTDDAARWSAAPAAPAASSGAPAGWSLERDGELWRVQHGDRTFRLEDRLGMRYLARLVADPGRELPALELAGASDEVDAGDAGAVLDPEARRAYRERLEEIEAELDEAERFGDAIRASRARTEREFLATELARAVGLGGRERRQGNAAERARIAVTRRLRDAVRRIASEDPDLGRWLDRAVRTGRYCSYQPM